VDVETPTENTEPGASLVGISERLAEFLGTTEREMTQTEASRRVWEYIKLKQLEVGNECIYSSLSLHMTFHIGST
jgi:upstream activation factor subunit UAF30